MNSESVHQIFEMIEAGVRAGPSAFDFEMAYQARVATDRIRFAIKHLDQLTAPCVQVQTIGMELLDALERLESLDRRFQLRTRVLGCGNGTGSAT